MRRFLSFTLLSILFCGISDTAAQENTIGYRRSSGEYADIGIGCADIDVENGGRFLLYRHCTDTIPADTVWTQVIPDTVPHVRIFRIPKEITITGHYNDRREFIPVSADTIWGDYTAYRRLPDWEGPPEPVICVEIKRQCPEDADSTDKCSVVELELLPAPTYECRNLAGRHVLHHSDTTQPLIPLRWLYGDSDDEAYGNGCNGWARVLPALRFRVLEQTGEWIRIVVDEESGRSLYLRSDLSAGNNPAVKKSLTVYTWIEYLNGVLPINTRWHDPCMYRNPRDSSRVVSQTTPHGYDIGISKMQGDWVRITDRRSRKRLGWKRWKKGNKLLIRVQEVLIM